MVSILSDKGLVRSLNEDFADFYEDEFRNIYVMADGMGGHNAGEVASRLAVETTIDYLRNQKNSEKSDEKLENAIKEANRVIYEKSKSDNALKGMGTTITACLVEDETLYVANVGDSSCFIIRQDNIIKVTKDHSLVQNLLDSGSITEEEALNHPNKNIITRALGTNENVDVDIFDFKLEGITKIILCTDGLTNEVNKSEIYDIVTQNDMETACRSLIELSKLKGGRDNISVIIFEGVCGNGRNYTE